MNNPAGKLVPHLIALVPWRFRNRLYRRPALSRSLRTILNRIFPSEDRPLPVRISAGPMKGLKMKIKFQSEKFFWLGTHEPEVQKAILGLAGEGAVAYDLGAYIGFFTLLLASRVGGRGQVIALEPNPHSYTRLRENIRLNRLANVRCLNLAAADSSSRRLFRLEEDQTPLEGHLVEQKADGGEGAAIEVETASLDDLVFSRGFPAPQLVKIDVEGSELAVLAGMRRVLEECRPAVICEVHSRADGREAEIELRQRGYGISDLEREELRPGTGGDGPDRRYFLARPGTGGLG